MILNRWQVFRLYRQKQRAGRDYRTYLWGIVARALASDDDR